MLVPIVEGGKDYLDMISYLGNEHMMPSLDDGANQTHWTSYIHCPITMLIDICPIIVQACKTIDDQVW